PFFSCCSLALPPLPSFPTRRSSDLTRFWTARDASAPYAHLNVRSPTRVRMAASPSPQPSPLGRGSDLAHASRDLECFGSSSTGEDRKSTRLNSSHVSISYAVFCLKK